MFKYFFPTIILINVSNLFAHRNQLSFCGSNDLHVKIFHNHLTIDRKIEKLLATDG